MSLSHFVPVACDPITDLLWDLVVRDFDDLLAIDWLCVIESQVENDLNFQNIPFIHTHASVVWFEGFTEYNGSISKKGEIKT